MAVLAALPPQQSEALLKSVQEFADLLRIARGQP